MYHIKVELNHLDEQTLYAVFEGADMKSVDTIEYNGKGAFDIRRPVDDFRTLTLYYDNRSNWITVYLEPSLKITIKGDAVYPQLAEVKGGDINETLSHFKKETAPLLKELTDITRNHAETYEIKNGNTPRIVNVNHEIHLRAEEFIRKHPDQKASAVLIRDYFGNTDEIHLIDELLGALNPKIDDFYVVRELKTFTEKAKKTIVGAQAPDFNVRDIHGVTYTAKSFNKQYNILAFISVWDDMCHTQDLFLDEIIKTFPGDSLNVILVCLDENPEKIRKETAGTSIRWNVVTDSLGQAIDLIDTYNVASIPLCYLIDREGMIVLKTDNGIELKHELNNLIQAKL